MPNNNRLKLEISDIKKFSVDPLFYLNNLKKDYTEIVITSRAGKEIIFNLENLTNSDIAPFEAYRSAMNNKKTNLLVIGMGKAETEQFYLWFYDIEESRISYWDNIYTKQDMIKNGFAKCSIIFLEPLIKDEKLTEQEKIIKIKEALERGATLDEVKGQLFIDIVRRGYAILTTWLLEKNPELINTKNENSSQFQRLILVSFIKIIFTKKYDSMMIDSLTKIEPFINDSNLKALLKIILHRLGDSDWNNAQSELKKCKPMPEVHLLQGYLQESNRNLTKALEYFSLAFDQAIEEQNKINNDTNFPLILTILQELAVNKLKELVFLSNLNQKENEKLLAHVKYQIALKTQNTQEKQILFIEANQMGHTKASLLLVEQAINQKHPNFLQAIQYCMDTLNAKYELNISDISKAVKKLEEYFNKLKENKNLDPDILSELQLKVVWMIRDKAEAKDKNLQLYKPFLEKLARENFIPAKYVLLVHYEAPSATIFTRNKISKQLQAIQNDFLPAMFTYANWVENGANGIIENIGEAFLIYANILLYKMPKLTDFEKKLFIFIKNKGKEKIDNIVNAMIAGTLGIPEAKKKISDELKFKFIREIFFALAEENFHVRQDKLQKIKMNPQFSSFFGELFHYWFRVTSDKKLLKSELEFAKEVLFLQNTNFNVQQEGSSSEKNLYLSLEPYSTNTNSSESAPTPSQSNLYSFLDLSPASQAEPSAPFWNYEELQNSSIGFQITESATPTKVEENSLNSQKETVMLSTPNLGETNLSTEIPLQNQPVAAKEEVKIFPENQSIAAESLPELNQNTSVAETAPSPAELLSNLSQEQNVDLEMKFDPITLSDIHNSSSEESLSESENISSVTSTITTENLSQPDANEFLLDDLKIEPQNQSNLNQTEIKIEDSSQIEPKIDSSLKQIENVENSLEQKTIYSQDVAVPTPSPKKTQANNKNAFWEPFAQRDKELNLELDVLTQEKNQLLAKLEQVNNSIAKKQGEKQNLRHQNNLRNFDRNKVPNAEEAWKENELTKKENRMEKNPTPKGRTLV